MKRDQCIKKWVEYGIPEPIATHCASLNKEHWASKKVIARIERFATYKNDPEQMTKDWQAIASSSKRKDEELSQSSGTNLITLFSVFPDGPVAQTFSGVFRHRDIDVGEERCRYSELLNHAKALKTLRKHDNLCRFIADAAATLSAAEALVEFRSVEVAFFDGLRKLIRVLEVIDPTAKIPTEHWAGREAPKKNYVILLSALNRYLDHPKWQALARLANINCQEVQITGDALSKAWKAGADKRA